jgi:hypothetical protein
MRLIFVIEDITYLRKTHNPNLLRSSLIKSHEFCTKCICLTVKYLPSSCPLTFGATGHVTAWFPILIVTKIKGASCFIPLNESMCLQLYTCYFHFPIEFHITKNLFLHYVLQLSWIRSDCHFCYTLICSLAKLLVTCGSRIPLLIHNQMLLFIVTFSTAIGKQCSSQSSNENGFLSSWRKFLIKS